MYFTTLIFTFLLSHIASAMPACGDVVSPQDIYDKYDSEQLVFATYRATLDQTYDNPNVNTARVACSGGKYGLDSKHPLFKDFITFPHIGGAFDTRRNTAECGKCWKLTNQKNNWPADYFHRHRRHHRKFQYRTGLFPCIGWIGGGRFL